MWNLVDSSSEGMAHDLPLMDKAKHISPSLVAYGSSRPQSCVVHLPIGAFVAVVAPLFENAPGLYHTCQTFVGATHFAAFRLVYWSSNVGKLYRLLETDWIKPTIGDEIALPVVKVDDKSRPNCSFGKAEDLPRSSPSDNSWLFPKSRSCCLVDEIAVWVRGLPFLEYPAYASSHVFQTSQIKDSNHRPGITMASSKKDKISGWNTCSIVRRKVPHVRVRPIEKEVGHCGRYLWGWDSATLCFNRHNSCSCCILRLNQYLSIHVNCLPTNYFSLHKIPLVGSWNDPIGSHQECQNCWRPNLFCLVSLRSSGWRSSQTSWLVWSDVHASQHVGWVGLECDLWWVDVVSGWVCLDLTSHKMIMA